MNKARRTRLQAVLDELEAIAMLEEDAFFNLPDSLQQAEKGLRIESNYEALQEAIETLNGVLEP
jgi:hypothetical protein